MKKFIHSGNIGDVIYSLPTVREMGGGEIYLRTDVPARYRVGVLHPLGKVRMDVAYAGMLLPLLREQPYITRAELWQGETGVDLDAFRSVPQLNQGGGNITRYYAYACSCWPDLSQPWLTVQPDHTYAGMLVVNRTKRYRNLVLDYSVLKDRKDVVFIGLPEEWDSMKGKLGNVPFLTVKDYLQLARIILGARGFIGNQSSAFALAEGLKVKRILEVFPFAPNVITGGYDCYTQDNFTRAINVVLSS